MTDSGTTALVVFFDLGGTLVTAHSRKWIPGAQAVLAALREKGVRLGILSNTAELDRKGLEKILPPGFDWSVFEEDLIVLSSEVGVEKPDPRIFKLALDRAGGTRAVFCAEDPTHSLASQFAGLPCVRIVPPVDGNLVQPLTTLEELHLVK